MIDRTKEPMTTWEVKFEKKYFTWLVKAHTFIEAVEEAKRIAERECLDLDELTSVKYVMY
jgi:hypothetical protein